MLMIMKALLKGVISEHVIDWQYLSLGDLEEIFFFKSKS